MEKDKIYKKAEELNMEVLEILGEKVKLKCKTHPEKPERWSNIYYFMKKQKTCSCRTKFYTEEDFKKDIEGITNIKLYGKYIKDEEKTEFICPKGHIFLATLNKIKQRRGCPLCKRQLLREKFLKSGEEFKKEVESKYKSIIIDADSYQGAFYPVKYTCKICGRVSMSLADKVKTGEASCHFCSMSKGEREIRVFLEEEQIPFEQQKKFDGCVYKSSLFFDFYLPEYNMCIEFQGEQHYFPVDFSYTPTLEKKEHAKKVFHENQIRDQIKRDFCKNNNIKLLEISYKQIKEISQILRKELNI